MDRQSTRRVQAGQFGGIEIRTFKFSLRVRILLNF